MIACRRRPSADLPAAADHVFVARQLLEPHGASRVELLSGDTHLAPETEFAAVCEARGRVDVYRRAVDERREEAGGIFVLGISMGQMDDVPGYVAALIGVGAALCLVGLVLAFLSKYIPQFAFILVGTVVYMQGASYIIDKAVTRVGEGIGLTEEQKEFPSKWRFGLYPIMLMTALSAVLLIIWIVRKLRAKHRRQKDFDNSPVKSIVED